MHDKNLTGTMDIDEAVTLFYQRYGKEHVDQAMKEVYDESTAQVCARTMPTRASMLHAHACFNARCPRVLQCLMVRHQDICAKPFGASRPCTLRRCPRDLLCAGEVDQFQAVHAD